jgi:sugar lactone lactonase YvrE
MACVVWNLQFKLMEEDSDMRVTVRALAHKTWQSIASIRTCALAASLILIFVLVPSVWAGKKKAAPFDISTLVWPPPPDPPRIRYLGQYFGELDLLGKKQAQGGILERLAGVSVAPEDRPRMVRPYGVAVDSKGRVYVADVAVHEVFVFDLEHKTLEFRGDKAPANLSTPIGVALDEQDRLFVSDSKLHQITCFGPDGNVAGVFGTDDLQRPAGMAVDNPLRRLYVADVGGKRIAVFDLDSLKLLRYFAEFKDKDKDADRTGALTNPNSIAIDPDGLLYITDAIVPRVIVYDTDGNFVRAWGKRGDGPGMFGRPKGIAIDADGHVYVADAQINRLQIFSPEGKPLLSFGSYGWNPGQFTLMGGLAADSRNRIIAVDQFPPRIEVFRYITDAEAAAAKEGRAVPEVRGAPAAASRQTATPSKVQPEAQSAAKPAASSEPTIEELQKELEELKAKLAARQQQKPDAAGKETKPANQPDQEAPSPPK